jgi:hypothetical protein
MRPRHTGRPSNLTATTLAAATRAVTGRQWYRRVGPEPMPRSTADGANCATRWATRHRQRALSPATSALLFFGAWLHVAAASRRGGGTPSSLWVSFDADADALAFQVGGQRFEVLPSTAFGEAHGGVRCGRAEARCPLLTSGSRSQLLRACGVKSPVSSRLPRAVHLLDWDTALRFVPSARYSIVFQPGERGGYRAIPMHKVRLQTSSQQSGDPLGGLNSSNQLRLVFCPPTWRVLGPAAAATTLAACHKPHMGTKPTVSTRCTQSPSMPWGVLFFCERVMSGTMATQHHVRRLCVYACQEQFKKKLK